MQGKEQLERASLIDQVYACQGWALVFQPMLEEKYRTYQLALRNPDAARKARMPDDYVRGWLEALEWIMLTPRREAEVERNAGIEEVLVKQRHDEDMARASVGFGSGMTTMLDDFS